MAVTYGANNWMVQKFSNSKSLPSMLRMTNICLNRENIQIKPGRVRCAYLKA